MEIWKDIEGYENLYLISNFGRVKSKDFLRVGKNGVEKLYKGKILKGCVNNIGYLCFDLYKDGKRKNIKSHYLCAKHFVEGYSENLCVNHKDGNKLNNHFLNLEWVTSKENVNHAFNRRLIVKKGFDIVHLETGLFFESIGDAYRTGLINFSLSHFKKMISGKKSNTTSFKLA